MNESLQKIRAALSGETLTIDQIIGRRVVLCESNYEYESEYRPFFYGDEFIIKSINGRIYNLVDDNGNHLSVLDKHIELI